MSTETVNQEKEITEETNSSLITEEQKQRIEMNRLKAIEKRNRNKLVPHPYAKNLKQTDENLFFSVAHNVKSVAGKKVIDSGGGFLIEEDEDDLVDEAMRHEFLEEPAPIIECDRPSCIECKVKFGTSYLFETFDYPVCDGCRDNDDKHALITRTDARNEYLLKDCDLDKREPILKFIERKNPHNPRWGTMKLYLQVQIEKRALEVWGSEDNLREQLEKRDEKRVLIKTKKYNKQMKELRMAVRSSLYDKTSKASHEHKFGPDSYDEEKDVYRHTCVMCDYEEEFEKM